ncbi:hypothetical protein cyc_06529 [Cyclospora cayetanensis]|uniref:Uncharacterized protein n=1 Tax=Cyclospora cayetanensis TaxID=88456 RepID=A0A1D3CUE2_9EIME|nr:hypothetical protein cyc_06529 [Cyclospora cayetanensis]
MPPLDAPGRRKSSTVLLIAFAPRRVWQQLTMWQQQLLLRSLPALLSVHLLLHLCSALLNLLQLQLKPSRAQYPEADAALDVAIQQLPLEILLDAVAPSLKAAPPSEEEASTDCEEAGSNAASPPHAAEDTVSASTASSAATLLCAKRRRCCCCCTRSSASVCPSNAAGAAAERAAACSATTGASGFSGGGKPEGINSHRGIGKMMAVLLQVLLLLQLVVGKLTHVSPVAGDAAAGADPEKASSHAKKSVVDPLHGGCAFSLLLPAVS